MRNYSDIGIDLGNSKFSICVKGEGVVASEPSFLAYKGDYLSDASIVAIGDEAYDMYERSHRGITVVTPMREGIVIDCRVASLILNRLAKKAGIKWSLSKPKTLVAALYGSSDLERKAFIDVAESLRCKRATIVHEPLAAANATDIDMSEPYANMVIDIGDGATEAIVVAMGQVILGNSMRFGGHDVDTLIVDHLRKRHSIQISRSQARSIKESLTTIKHTRQDTKIKVKGVALPAYLPCEKLVDAADFEPILEKVTHQITEFVLSTLARVPPEVSVDLIENGLYVCGGTSQMLHLQEKLGQRTRLNIQSIDKPRQTVIDGLNRMLDFARLTG